MKMYSMYDIVSLEQIKRFQIAQTKDFLNKSSYSIYQHLKDAEHTEKEIKKLKKSLGINCEKLSCLKLILN